MVIHTSAVLNHETHTAAYCNAEFVDQSRFSSNSCDSTQEPAISQSAYKTRHDNSDVVQERWTMTRIFTLYDITIVSAIDIKLGFVENLGDAAVRIGLVWWDERVVAGDHG